MPESVAVNNRKEIANIKMLYDTGKISREEAKQLAEPVLKRIYDRQQEIAAKYGVKKYPKLDFINAMR